MINVVLRATLCPRFDIASWIRRYPHVRLSLLFERLDLRVLRGSAVGLIYTPSFVAVEDLTSDRDFVHLSWDITRRVLETQLWLVVPPSVRPVRSGAGRLCQLTHFRQRWSMVRASLFKRSIRDHPRILDGDHLIVQADIFFGGRERRRPL